MTLTRRAFTASFALVLCCAGAVGVYAQELFEKEPLVIEHQDGRKSDFTIELALSPQQRAQGLMNRRSMDFDQGMLFDFDEDRLVMMWMKNTYIPLDMLFVAKDGHIAHIHKNAIPHDETVISSQGDVRFVIELVHGAVEKLQIKVGDKAHSAQIEKANK